MEPVSLILFVSTNLRSPLSPTSTLALTSPTGIFPNAPSLSLSHPPIILAAAYITHYLNRALVSPLCTPSRSGSPLLVVSAAVCFKVVNGSLMDAYLSSPSAQTFLCDAFARPSFWLGLGLWAVGFAGNEIRDEILLNLRRNAKISPKAADDDDANDGKINTCSSTTRSRTGSSTASSRTRTTSASGPSCSGSRWPRAPRRRARR